MPKNFLLPLLALTLTVAACGSPQAAPTPAPDLQTPSSDETSTPTPVEQTPSGGNDTPPADMVSVDYAGSDQTLNNPYRGFYHSTETFSGDYQPLDLAQLQAFRAEENITLIFREFYLEDFVDGPISDDYLANIRQDLDVVRAAGFTIFVRFAYTQRGEPPYRDAPKDVVLAHIDQLRPIFHDYSDIIKVVQAGFIGSWGEWYFTDYFGFEDLTPQDYAARQAVVSALLQATPPETFIQLRTPFYKQKFWPDAPLNAATAYTAADPARVGFHNDCFLASEDDYGTFLNDTERDYMAHETVYAPMGGETCGPNPPRSSCPSAMDEMALYHWSFLNIDYHEDVLASWREDGCFDQVQNQLGYRLALQNAQFSEHATPRGPFQLAVTLKNEGWAAPYFKTTVEFILRDSVSQKEYRFPVDDDPRYWLPSDAPYTLAHTICLPADLPTGQYDLLLRLSPTDAPDPAVYAIQLANELEWEADSGLNNLDYVLAVQPGAAQGGCESK